MQLKTYIYSILFFSLSYSAFGQIDEIDILNEFVTTQNDSLFSAKYSKQPYQKIRAERNSIPHAFEPTDSMIFYHHQKGDILGPYYLDSFTLYLKVTAVDSLIRMRVGNIWLDPEKRGKDSINRLAAKIMKTIHADGNYDEMCKLYADDHNKNHDCELEWFFQGVMVYEFEKEVINRKKGEILLVKTGFGKHIVKILDNPVLDRHAVEYIVLYLDKK